MGKLESERVYIFVYHEKKMIYLWIGKESPVREHFIGYRKLGELEAKYKGFKTKRIDEGREDPEFITFLSSDNVPTYQSQPPKEKLNLVKHQSILAKLKSNQVYIFVYHEKEIIYMWKGKESSATERLRGSKRARALQKKLPTKTFPEKFYNYKIVQVNQGEEDPEFLKCLSNYDEDRDNRLPYPYVYRPPKPPDDLAPAFEAQKKLVVEELLLWNGDYCPHCGSPLPEGALICSNCGRNV